MGFQADAVEQDAVGTHDLTALVWWDGTPNDAGVLKDQIVDRWHRRTGFLPDVTIVTELPDLPPVSGSESLIFVAPAFLEYSLLHRERLAEWSADARRLGYDVHFDEPDTCAPPVIQANVDCASKVMGEGRLRPRESGLIVLADGRGDAMSRASSYRMMSLIWEHLGVSEAEVVFLHHTDRCLQALLPRLADAPLDWIVVPQGLGHEAFEEAQAMVESATGCADFHWSEPASGHEAISAWIDQRMSRLWESYRQRENRVRSFRKLPERESTVYGPGAEIPIRELSGKLPEAATYGGNAVVATVDDAESLGRLLTAFGIDDAGPVFIKVTWHGYATGTYTDSVSLDRLLGALPGPAVLVEGHTISKNRSDSVNWDWEEDCCTHRDWILKEERAYLESTGIQDVMDRHGATYVNVTEATWDGQCATRERVLEVLSSRGVFPTTPELCDAIPSILFDHLDRPLISFARFKGPTRLSVSNCFGLLPGPYRGAWHGPDVTYFARVCSEMSRIYGTLFTPYGLNEAFNVAVRWSRSGLYRSRWGHYDLVPGRGAMTMSKGFAPADFLACRLQGQSPDRSAFYDNVSRVLDVDRGLYSESIAPKLIRRFA